MTQSMINTQITPQMSTVLRQNKMKIPKSYVIIGSIITGLPVLYFGGKCLINYLVKKTKTAVTNSVQSVASDIDIEHILRNLLNDKAKIARVRKMLNDQIEIIITEQLNNPQYMALVTQKIDVILNTYMTDIEFRKKLMDTIVPMGNSVIDAYINDKKLHEQIMKVVTPIGKQIISDLVNDQDMIKNGTECVLGVLYDPKIQEKVNITLQSAAENTLSSKSVKKKCGDLLYESSKEAFVPNLFRYGNQKSR